MIFIKYSAFNKEMKVFLSFRVCHDLNEFKEYLKNKNLILIEYKKFSLDINFRKKYISKNELLTFFQELGIMLKSGLTILNALKLLKNETKNQKLKEICENLVLSIKKGHSLSSVIKDYHNILGDLYINMIIIGEQSGNLPKILDIITSNIKKNMLIEKKIKSVLFYPTFVIFLTAVLSIFLINFVLPEFIKLFDQNGEQLPFLTVILIDIYNFFNNFLTEILLFLTVFSVFSFFYLKNKKNSFAFYFFFSFFPPFKKMYKLYFSVFFFRNLSILLDAGISLFNTITILSTIEKNPYLKNELLTSKQELNTGKSFSETLKKSSFFPHSAISMLSIGETSGNLSEMASHACELLSNQFNNITDSFLLLIEPITILFLGITIGTIVFGLYLPMFNMLSLIK